MAQRIIIVTYTLSIIIFLVGLTSLGGGLYLVSLPYNVDFNLLFDDAKKDISDMFQEINKCEKVAVDVCKKLPHGHCGMIDDYCQKMKINNPPNIAGVNPWPNTKFSVIVKGFGMFLCVFGFAQCALSLIGIAWIWKKRNRLKILFATIMTLVLLLEVVIAVIYLKYPFIIGKYISKVLLESFDENYVGLVGHDEVSMAWNIIMKKFDCCGVHSYRDISSSKTFNDTWISIFHSVRIRRKTEFPLVCCNTIDILPKDRFSGPCNDLSYENKKGCVDVFWEALSNYNTPIIVYVVVSSLVKIILLVISYTALITKENACRVYPNDHTPNKRIVYPQKMTSSNGNNHIQGEKLHFEKRRRY